MKTLRPFMLILCMLGILTTTYSQEDNPVYALQKINEAVNKFNIKYLAYQSTLAHGSKIRKSEKKRQEMMTQLDESRYAIAEVPYYKGDKSLHQSTTNYLKLITDLLNENYKKLVNLEDIAEQSYDDMEAYIMLKKQVSEKMEKEAELNHQKVVEYCAKNNITLTEKDDSENGQKMKQVGEVMDYYNEIYLTFFKASVQEDYFMKALNAKNVTAMEQAKSAMIKYSDEGLEKLKELKSFKGDATMLTACRNSLNFFKKEADKSVAFTDYLLKEESFDKIKKNFEKSSAAQSDKAEVKKYNDAVNEINKSLNTFNSTNQSLNIERDNMYKNWNAGVKTFMDQQIPYSK